jgi:hypothetical protein
MKKDFLKNNLAWTDDWVASVMEYFTTAFTFYQTKLQLPQRPNVANENGQDCVLAQFLKRKRRRTPKKNM